MSDAPDILDEGLIAQFAYQCGTVSTPGDFILWSGMALIAACAEDRVWLDRFRGSKLHPNIYVFLIGDSGIGKGVAINEAMDFANELPINVFTGRITGAGLIDYMSKPTLPGKRPTSRLFLVSSELRNDIRIGGLAGDFIAQMTEVYLGTKSFSDVTRTSGTRAVKNPVITWIAGTTPEWLLKSLTIEDIRSGFGARIVPVIVNNWDVPQRKPTYPADVATVERFMLARLKTLCSIEGPFKMSPAAEDIESEWMARRVEMAPANADERPFYQREPALMLKLAMIFSLSDSDSLLIRAEHMNHAIRACARLRPGVRQLLGLANVSGRGTEYERIRDLIRRDRVVNRTKLTIVASRRGILANELNAIMSMLVATREVTAYKRSAGGAIEYHWTGDSRMPVLDDTDPEGSA